MGNISSNNHKKEVLEAFEKKIEEGLEICGMIAEGYAKENLTANQTVDTGLLRNSITYAVSSKAPAITSYKADRGGAAGSYSGTAPDDENPSVYIGTNVKYAPYIELGTGKYYPGGRQTPWAYEDANGEWHRTAGMVARPFLKPAVANHGDEYRQALEATLKGTRNK